MKPSPCKLFVELCAGTAAVSLRLHGGKRARPPVSRMGAKTGYATAILRVLGLRPGQGYADGTRYLWCEPDAGVRLLLEAYRDRDLALAAAEIIRSWKDEDPRALWERLRAEGPVRCPEGLTAREVARWLFAQVCHHSQQALKPIPEMDGFLHPEDGGRYGASRDDVQRRCCSLPTVPATIHPDAREVEPPPLSREVVAYMDPPYVGTTGYADALPREDAVMLARRWDAAGATVCISEAEPIPDLVADGWHAVEITNERRGQRRTFSKQQAEWLTINREPAWVPPVQGMMF